MKVFELYRADLKQYLQAVSYSLFSISSRACLTLTGTPSGNCSQAEKIELMNRYWIPFSVSRTLIALNLSSRTIATRTKRKRCSKSLPSKATRYPRVKKSKEKTISSQEEPLEETSSDRAWKLPFPKRQPWRRKLKISWWSTTWFWQWSHYERDDVMNTTYSISTQPTTLNHFIFLPILATNIPPQQLTDGLRRMVPFKLPSCQPTAQSSSFPAYNSSEF